MSHRIYLFNLPNEAYRPTEDGVPEYTELPQAGSVHMMEWKYEFPFFLHPLFAGRPYLGAASHNQVGGIYGNATEGILALIRLYDFIDAHAEVLTDDPAAFRVNKENIYDFLTTKMRYDSFHLYTADVFSMNDIPHEEQGAELLEQIQHTNAAIEAAIEANDPLLLNECPDVQHNFYGFTSFRQYFSTGVYGYGWDVITSDYYEPGRDSGQERFTENGLTGLKIAGKIIVPAEYDDVYEFPDNEKFTVVIRDGKAGYVNTEGQPVTGLIYDMAYSTLNSWAVVKVNDQFYVLQAGAPLPAAGYDDISILSESPQRYIAGRNGRYGVINAAGTLLLPFDFDADMRPEYFTDSPVFNARHLDTGMRHYYTPEFTRIGNDDVDAVAWGGTYQGNAIFYFIRWKPKLQYGLYTAEGKELLPMVYDKLESILFDTMIVRQGNLNGIFSVSKGWLVPLSPVGIELTESYACIITQDGKEGMYIWDYPLIPPVYDTILREYTWHNTNSWDAIAIQGDTAFAISQDASIKQLTSADIAKEISSDTRYRYSDTSLAILTRLAGEDIPGDLLYEKGFEAFEAKDYEQAIRLYKKAAAKGDAGSMNDLGYIYETIGGYVDAMAAFDWYDRGVKAGSPHAANGLGNCYQYGTGTSPDIRKALELYQQAASQHVPYAHYNLAMLYYEGVKVPKDHQLALKHFLYASNLGVDCYNYAGILFEAKEDYKNAVDAYRKGIKNKDSFCAFNLARLYETGEGVKPDARKALSHYMKAMEFGMEDAVLELRRMYRYNEEVKDETKALQYEQQAREAGLDIPV
ncbi:SEL1-like repeat protein [Chitinophaga qingshengii]|uniref:Sel1 repeat family protein n=1 Tax=Chitinophaga qingshengii TaxID=1569794 RepID=A0ABR7TUR2_9BACT|nr:tetratricopeptide repeat protein [Chitinophaga qingshengii]MBC9934172.1 sel1 repeat family protein [Chitinophaga qingshengii]